jgi:hypothetical protein
MVCRNICERIYSKIVVGESYYLVGKKYCRRCECYFITKEIFCKCCGMQLRATPAEGELKEKLNKKIKMEKKKENLEWGLYRSLPGCMTNTISSTILWG